MVSRSAGIQSVTGYGIRTTEYVRSTYSVVRIPYKDIMQMRQKLSRSAQIALDQYPQNQFLFRTFQRAQTGAAPSPQLRCNPRCQRSPYPAGSRQDQIGRAS